MGLWWKSTKTKPSKEKGLSFTFDGDKNAPSKCLPILWRYFQNWHILKVERFEGPFYLHFHSANGQRMKHRLPIYKGHVAVRIGPERVTFWAVSETGGRDPKITDTGLWIPGWFRKDTRTANESVDAHHFSKRTEFV